MYAIDTETHLIGEDGVHPRIVCLTACDTDGGFGLLPNTDDIAGFVEMLMDSNQRLVGHNLAFDMAVLGINYPHLLPKIFEHYEKGLCTCTRIREKLLNLSSHGRLEYRDMPDGSSIPIKYSLSELEKKYLGEDRSHLKKGDDIWRLRYSELDGVELKDWPEDAVSYALDDAMNTMLVWQAQEVRCSEKGLSMETQELHSHADFCLHLMTEIGFKIDGAAREKLLYETEQAIKEPERILAEAGVFRPAQPEMPYKNGAKDRDGNPKMKKAQPGKMETKRLQEQVAALCAYLEIQVPQTEKGRISVSKSTMAELLPKARGTKWEAMLQAFHDRQAISKLLTTEIPRIMGRVVRGNFDPLKETGRTSSFASSLYPSANVQNVDPRIRPCYIAREGYVLCSVDYSSLELVSLAQTCLRLFGHSKMAELINGGMDLHAYLGTSMAFAFDTDFRENTTELEREQRYQYFLALEDTEPEFYGHYRTFAKPTGLGFPGGLGAETFVTYARATYGVDLVEIAGNHESAIELAKQLKELWLATYPEMRQYFQYINDHCQDPWNEDCYVYRTPMGMVRRGASYCAASNGLGMQSPSAEGAKLAINQVTRACWDGTMDDTLYGSRPLAFIHDELIVEVPEENAHACAASIQEHMESAMQRAFPDMRIGTEAALMYRWDKRAKPVYNEEGVLIPWQPQRSAV